MGSLSPVHWLIVLLVLVILFGSKRLPDAAKGLGKSLKIIKSEMRTLADEDNTNSSISNIEQIETKNPPSV